MCERPRRTDRPDLRVPDADRQEAAIGPDRRLRARLKDAKHVGIDEWFGASAA
jgi:hypothetical protein